MMMYDLDRKLLDLNKQILSYKLAINQGIDPLLAGSMLGTNSVLNQINPQVNTQTESPQQTVIQNQTPQQQIVQQQDIVDAHVVEDEFEDTDSSDSEELPHSIPRGPRGKRGKRGPQGIQGPAGRDGSFNNCLDMTLVDDNYSVSKECMFVVVNSSKDITIDLPDEVPDGKLLVIKVLSAPPHQNSREITLKSDGAGMIEGDFSFVLRGANECLVMFCFKGDWFILNHYKST